MTEIKLEELWIGDKLRVIKNGRIGEFIGKDQHGHAKLRFGKEEGLFMVSEIELVVESEPEFDWSEWLDEKHPVQKKPKPLPKFSTEIDLHFDDGKKGSLLPEQVLDQQLDACKLHIEMAIAKRINRIVIIHGKGEGVLRHLVHQLLENYTDVQWKMVINQGGATEVIFYYR
ncbi:MAG: Smr/MutS family protein [Saprospiraceae bacterium]|nr:Smr/MutS family protein [Saprospiraceae bacterium]